MLIIEFVVHLNLLMFFCPFDFAFMDVAILFFSCFTAYINYVIYSYIITIEFYFITYQFLVHDNYFDGIVNFFTFKIGPYDRLSGSS